MRRRTGMEAKGRMAATAVHAGAASVARRAHVPKRRGSCRRPGSWPGLHCKVALARLMRLDPITES